MKHWMEDWVERMRLEGATKSAFDESFIAYKAGAYRAALVFSYIGMNLCLRHRLVKAACPDGYEEKEWKKAIKNLQDDDVWDRSVFDLTQSKAPKRKAFDISDHLREEVKYWKNRRNDCAHFKRNEIEASHVESFWLFLKSNLGKLVPGGSAKDILNRLVEHYDPGLTRPGSDVSPIVADLSDAVDLGRMAEFLDSLVEQFALSSTLGASQMFRIEPVAEVVSLLLVHGHRDSEVVEWLVGQKNKLPAEVIRRSPSLVNIFAGRPKTLRKLWSKQLFIGDEDLEILAALLKSGLVPKVEIDELLERACENTGGQVLDDPVFDSGGFWELFDRKMVDKVSVFKWANRNAPLVAYRVSSLAKGGRFSDELCRSICHAFSDQWHPRALLPLLRGVFVSGSDARRVLEECASKAGVEVPMRLAPRPD